MFHRFLTKFSAAAVPCRGSQSSGFRNSGQEFSRIVAAGPVGRLILSATAYVDQPQVRTPNGFVLRRTGGYTVRWAAAYLRVVRKT